MRYFLAKKIRLNAEKCLDKNLFVYYIICKKASPRFDQRQYPNIL